MKDIIFKILIISLVLFTSCTDVINVDVPIEEPRLVVDASLDWQKGTSGNEQSIKLSLSTPYFSAHQENPVETATVTVTKLDDHTTFVFTHTSEGIYTTNTFVPQLNTAYRLYIVYNGETYTATEILQPFSGITKVEQSLEGGIEDDLIDISTFWNDPVGKGDNYLMRYKREGDAFPFYEVQDDRFTDGNENFDFFEIEKPDEGEEGEEPLTAGDIVEISIFSISKNYYTYFGLLLEQSDNDGNPFAIIPARVEGNCMNVTTPSNYALGYFRVTEFDQRIYTVQ